MPPEGRRRIKQPSTDAGAWIGPHWYFCVSSYQSRQVGRFVKSGLIHRQPVDAAATVAGTGTTGAAAGSGLAGLADPAACDNEPYSTVTGPNQLPSHATWGKGLAAVDGDVGGQGRQAWHLDGPASAWDNTASTWEDPIDVTQDDQGEADQHGAGLAYPRRPCGKPPLWRPPTGDALYCWRTRFDAPQHAASEAVTPSGIQTTDEDMDDEWDAWMAQKGYSTGACPWMPHDACDDGDDGSAVEPRHGNLDAAADVAAGPVLPWTLSEAGAGTSVALPVTAATAACSTAASAALPLGCIAAAAAALLHANDSSSSLGSSRGGNVLAAGAAAAHGRDDDSSSSPRISSHGVAACRLAAAASAHAPCMGGHWGQQQEQQQGQCRAPAARWSEPWYGGGACSDCGASEIFSMDEDSGGDVPDSGSASPRAPGPSSCSCGRCAACVGGADCNSHQEQQQQACSPGDVGGGASSSASAAVAMAPDSSMQAAALWAAVRAAAQAQCCGSSVSPTGAALHSPVVAALQAVGSPSAHAGGGVLFLQSGTHACVVVAQAEQQQQLPSAPISIPSHLSGKRQRALGRSPEGGGGGGTPPAWQHGSGGSAGSGGSSLLGASYMRALPQSLVASVDWLMLHAVVAGALFGDD